MPDEKSVAELLTDQFYAWELRGRGQLVSETRVELEPPFREFRGHSVPQAYFVDDGVAETSLSRLADSVLSLFGKREAPPLIESPVEESEPEITQAKPRDDLLELQVVLPKDYRPLPDVFEQCLFSLRFCRSALSFEIIADKTEIVAQLVGERRDAEQLFAQLKAHFPEAIITPVHDFLDTKWSNVGHGVSEVCEFGLVQEFMLPLELASHLATDPLVAICGALEYLGDEEVGVFQVLFQPVRQRWAQSILRAVTTTDGEPFFENAPEILSETKKKLSRPLFAAVARVAAKSPEEDRVWHVIKSIAGALSLFDNPAGNRLGLLTNDGYQEAGHEEDLLTRSTHRSGMILNSDELTSLAHLPSAAVRSRKLKRETKRTKAAPSIAMGDGAVLGENVHEGQVVRVSLKQEQRMRHMHVIGASGTGKSTLLLNLICQDIYKGRGVGVLDPHGDLVDQVLGYVLPERYKDVILFDASDTEYPIGFNILSAHSELEKNLLSSDLVSVFQRLSTTWGDQMRSVLGNAILAYLESSQGGTLADLRRFLIERQYRDEFLKTVSDPEVVYYWQQQFPLLKSNSVGPLLTRLDTFLRPKTIRYMVGQKENKLDFAAIMNEGKILLAKLPQGIIGEENAFLLGTLLVSKFHQLIISRQEMLASERRPFFLFIDECHHFTTPSMATILSGVRKYQLSLVLAHHEMAQLSGCGEVASAILAQPYTRACFRVGSEDARRIAEGFSFFEPKDLQNLGTGEAICRVERSDFDFNLRTLRPPELDADAPRRREYLRYLTRQQYGTPWQKVEEELAKSRFRPKEEAVDPFAKRMAKQKSKSEPGEGREPEKKEGPPPSPVPEKPNSVPVPPPAAPRPPKEDAAIETVAKAPVAPKESQPDHETTKEQIRRMAEGLGFEVFSEQLILNGQRRVDVSLRRGALTIACEICATTTDEHEFGKVSEYFAAGFGHVILVSTNPKRLTRMKTALSGLSVPEAGRVQCCSVKELFEFLEEQALQTDDDPKRPKKRGISLGSNLSESDRKRTEKTMLQKIAERMRKKKNS